VTQVLFFTVPLTIMTAALAMVFDLYHAHPGKRSITGVVVQ